MSSTAPKDSDSPPSEDERLQLLTAAGRRNRLFILALAGVLGSLMLLSVGFNFYALLSAGDEPRIAALEQQVVKLRAQLATQQEALKHQEDLFASQQANQLTGLFARAENPDSITEVSQVLQAQEEDFQRVLQGLKSGMADLANMLPGSRSWLNLYNEPLDRALLNSRKRREAIQAWGDKAVGAQP
ncbi:hypothetical protein [Pseudomonas xionganensis]|uniref:Uncharacterized protein n=1 Tax=Pseudomonas xionganensis TaxID=2654845 RepID=A0A6I4KTZ1_9PSED|nr:hypothetical protein [Pseudomonas xionganensis]MVW74132.1 hypothetical protein [Pseudomonas xionganensis]